MAISIGAQPDHGFDDPLGLMRDCHRRIEKFLGLLNRVAEEIAGGPLPESHREALAAALRYFANAAPRHTWDEEESLFPRLRRADDRRVLKVMNRMDALERDHRQADEAHAVVHRLGTRWLENGTLDTAEAAELKRLLDELHATYAHHIEIEDGVVFPLARQVLASGAQAAIGREMAERRGLDSQLPSPRCRHANRETATNKNIQPPQTQPTR
jgi:hemerythrin-like domain-containing protein